MGEGQTAPEEAGEPQETSAQSGLVEQLEETWVDS